MTNPRRQVLPVMQAIYSLLCEEVSSTFSVDANQNFLNSERHSAVAKATVDASLHCNAQSFGLDYALSTFLSKYIGLKTGVNTAEVALKGWLSSEISCSLANSRIRNSRSSLPAITSPGKSLINIITDAQAKISKVIGNYPNFEKVTEQCKWSGGATFDLRRGTPLTKKMTERISVTINCLPTLSKVMNEDPRWVESITGFYPEGPVSLLKDNFKIVDGSRFLTVPKNAKTDRCIAAEPTGNSFIQSGAGRYIRGRLKRFGVNLDDQSWNQLLASKAHVLDLATLDLSAASDSICIEIIYLLLPIEWALYLDSIRCHFTVIKGEKVKLHKFSSMGNGFTFELESLVFWALSEACLEDNGECITGVYGDDIVVPRSVASRVIEVLEWSGFEINKSKSFVSGNFFESCGKHYFQGVDVTPIYQKALIDINDANFLPEIIRLHNRIFRWSIRMHLPWSFRRKLSREITNAVEMAVGVVPRIPWDDESDDGILTCPKSMKWDKNKGFYCLVLTFKSQMMNVWSIPLLAYKLRRPEYTSPDRKGHEKVGTADGQWKYSHRYYHSADEPSSYQVA